ncbi:hypothetical protein H4W79_002398 [Nocardiopsis terrae]|uniref:DUF4148 domain-containing protein n=1 Tax=Nocardiopsis terrae TaxID=372655 RepID=A0ABR9HGM4_9ACTN|nr:hypothetical protein [Nocardiopsis terrae]MBE1458184.1 hypothetical protein [Nocardiopsis terrae]
MKWWKALGAAAFVGVAASGVAIARAERQRRAYTPEQVRERLHARAAEVGRAEEGQVGTGTAGNAAVGTATGHGLRGPGNRVRSGLAAVRSGPPVATIGRLLRRVRGNRDGNR